jgi:catechol 2,3-dioxygenase-like lactoylglutathione lyase family enzyme
VAELLVNIDVDDLERGLEFYTRGLGLVPGRRLGEGAIELLGGSAPIYLLQKPGGSPAFTAPVAAARAKRDYRRHWTPVHLDFVVADLEAAVRRAEAAGARREGEILERNWGRLAMLCDPFGHGLCLLQFLGRGYDELTSS